MLIGRLPLSEGAAIGAAPRRPNHGMYALTEAGSILASAPGNFSVQQHQEVTPYGYYSL